MIVPTLLSPIYMRDKNVLSHNIELQVGIINIIRYNIRQVDSVISALFIILVSYYADFVYKRNYQPNFIWV